MPRSRHDVRLDPYARQRASNDRGRRGPFIHFAGDTLVRVPGVDASLYVKCASAKFLGRVDLHIVRLNMHQSVNPRQPTRSPRRRAGSRRRVPGEPSPADALADCSVDDPVDPPHGGRRQRAAALAAAQAKLAVQSVEVARPSLSTARSPSRGTTARSRNRRVSSAVFGLKSGSAWANHSSSSSASVPRRGAPFSPASTIKPCMAR